MYTPASKFNNDRNLVTITESSISATPGKPIGFSSCGTLFSNKFTVDDLRKVILKMGEKEPQLYLGICTTFSSPIDLRSPQKIVSPNSFKPQTRALVKREEVGGFSVLSSQESIRQEERSEDSYDEETE